MKRKLLSLFLSVVVALACPICIVPKASAEIIEDVSSSTSSDSKRSMDDRISEFKAFLDRCLSDEPWEEDEINKICDYVAKVIKEESHLLKVEGNVMIVGDTHSNLGSIECCCNKFLEEIEESSIIFLGDYVDRGKFAPKGPNGIKNVAILFKLKTLFPDKVVLLRGNHEDKLISERDGLMGECWYSGVFNAFNKINATFDYLSLTAVVNNNTFCVHGGISPELTPESNSNSELSPINEKITPLPKPLSSKIPLVSDLLWSDPSTEISDYGENKRGAGKAFGENAVNIFLEKNHLTRIVRAHELVPDGYRKMFKGDTVITLFSAPDYEMIGGNIASIMKIKREPSGIEKITYENIVYSDRLKIQ